jgi:hypothetical protein
MKKLIDRQRARARKLVFENYLLEAKGKFLNINPTHLKQMLLSMQDHRPDAYIKLYNYWNSGFKRI